MTKVIPPQFPSAELLCQLLEARYCTLRRGYVVAYAPQIFGLHSSKASHCIKGNHLPAATILPSDVKVVPHVKAIWAAGLICLTIVSMLPDFAISPASTIASRIKVTAQFLHCVTFALGNSWRTSGQLSILSPRNYSSRMMPKNGQFLSAANMPLMSSGWSWCQMTRAPRLFLCGFDMHWGPFLPSPSNRPGMALSLADIAK